MFHISLYKLINDIWFDVCHAVVVYLMLYKKIITYTSLPPGGGGVGYNPLFMEYLI